MRDVRLKKDVRASIDAGHPWIYRDALQASQGEPGELVSLLDRDGSLLAIGYLDEGVIGVRIVARKRRELEGDVMLRRVQAALVLRGWKCWRNFCVSDLRNNPFVGGTPLLVLNP